MMDVESRLRGTEYAANLANAEHRSRFVDSCVLLAGGARSDYSWRRLAAPARAAALAGTKQGARVSIAPECAKPVGHEFVLGQSASGSHSRLPHVRCADGEAQCPARPARWRQVLGLRELSNVSHQAPAFLKP